MPVPLKPGPDALAITLVKSPIPHRTGESASDVNDRTRQRFWALALKTGDIAGGCVIFKANGNILMAIFFSSSFQTRGRWMSHGVRRSRAGERESHPFHG